MEGITETTPSVWRWHRCRLQNNPYEYQNKADIDLDLIERLAEKAYR